MAFFLSAPVLIPCFDLSVGELEPSGELEPVLHAEILFSLETSLKFSKLMVGEGRARLSLFALRAVGLEEVFDEKGLVVVAGAGAGRVVVVAAGVAVCNRRRMVEVRGA